MLSDAEKIEVANEVVKKAKETAKVDQGTLRKSISKTILRGEIIFRQMYYGTYGDNSELEEIAKDLIPRGTAYRIELIDTDGGIFEVGKTKSGRNTVRSIAKKSARNESTNVRNLLKKAIALRKKRDDEKKHEHSDKVG